MSILVFSSTHTASGESVAEYGEYGEYVSVSAYGELRPPPAEFSPKPSTPKKFCFGEAPNANAGAAAPTTPAATTFAKSERLTLHSTERDQRMQAAARVSGMQ
jgi:hypothetical protein